MTDCVFCKESGEFSYYHFLAILICGHYAHPLCSEKENTCTGCSENPYRPMNHKELFTFSKVKVNRYWANEFLRFPHAIGTNGYGVMNIYLENGHTEYEMRFYKYNDIEPLKNFTSEDWENYEIERTKYVSYVKEIQERNFEVERRINLWVLSQEEDLGYYSN